VVHSVWTTHLAPTPKCTLYSLLEDTLGDRETASNLLGVIVKPSGDSSSHRSHVLHVQVTFNLVTVRQTTSRSMAHNWDRYFIQHSIKECQCTCTVLIREGDNRLVEEQLCCSKRLRHRIVVAQGLWLYNDVFYCRALRGSLTLPVTASKSARTTCRTLHRRAASALLRAAELSLRYKSD
jgi:hypothetical protein